MFNITKLNVVSAKRTGINPEHLVLTLIFASKQVVSEHHDVLQRKQGGWTPEPQPTHPSRCRFTNSPPRCCVLNTCKTDRPASLLFREVLGSGLASER